MAPSWLWIALTLAAAATQTLRNASQRDLLGSLGPACATYVRFLYGAPFAAIFLAVLCAASGVAPPAPDWKSLAWIALGASTQVAATALLLTAMRDRSFFATIALSKTEPLLVAVFAAAVLGERPGPAATAGLLLATAGVMLTVSPHPLAALRRGADGEGRQIGAAGLALGAAACFAISAIGFRAAILSAPGSSLLIAAASTLALALLAQSATILALLYAFDRPALRALRSQWRKSLASGFVGALASLLWFFAFALQSAALVRALGLIEAPLARIASRRLFAEPASTAETFGAVLIVGGLTLLLLG